MVDIGIFKPGTQVIYVPRHTQGDLSHPDCEEGFVTSVRKVDGVARVWCRFWSKVDHDRLRTLSCSEACNPGDLYVKDTRPQVIVDALLAKLYPGDWGE